MIKQVIFDLDGTLLDTLNDLANAGNYALQQKGFPTHPTEAYRYFVGNGIPVLIRRIVPAGTEVEIEQEVHRIFSDYYAEHKEDDTCPYPGIEEMLRNLQEKGIRLAVVTNKDDAPARAIVKHFFGERFDIILGRREGIAPKPNPAPVCTAMQEAGVLPEEVLYVGDSNVDMETAKNAGVAACGVLWGFRTREELARAGADFLVKTPDEIVQIIIEFPGKKRPAGPVKPD